MSNFMSYKGYTASMVYDTEDKILARELWESEHGQDTHDSLGSS